MLAIGNYDWLIQIMLMIFSAIPVIFFIGKIFTRHGWETLAANPLMFIYFIIFFAYAYFFWMYPEAILDYLGLGLVSQKLIYGALAIVPFFERDIVN